MFGQSISPSRPTGPFDMDILNFIRTQADAVRLPLVAVSLTALPRANTPVLLMLHWHGFRAEAEPPVAPGAPPPRRAVPGSALQINDPWETLPALDASMLDAAWQLGAWDLMREARRACNTVGVPDREALECRQAFGDDPLQPASEDHLIAEAPDRHELRELGARIGYLRWIFRPVAGGLWREVAEDDTLRPDGRRDPPCPVQPVAASPGREGRTRYRFGQVDRLILP
jgi:hypothetical protein